VKICYTRRAIRQLGDILDYIEARSPQGAENVKRRLKAAIDLLVDHPKSGRATDKGDLRRLVANP
jgi:toxin ParE1/3/4